MVQKMARKMIFFVTLAMVLALGGWSVYTQAPANPPAAPPAAQGAAPAPGRGGRGPGAPPYPSKVTMDQMKEWMAKYSNAGRWGPDDELGTLHFITPAKRLEAAKLIKTGETVSLAKPLVARTARTQAEPARVYERGGDESAYATQANQYVRERQEMEFHGAAMTHYDALCHVSWNGMLYNNVKRSDAFNETDGCQRMNATTAKPGIVTRGVFIELIGVHVTPKDIEAWEKKTGVKIEPGDALILKTKQRGSDNAMGTGWDMEMLPFLKEHDISIIGHDGGQDGAQIQGQSLPIHAMTMVALGMPLVDHMYLDDLSLYSEKTHRYTFMFMTLPLPIKGASGGAVNPIALF